MAGLAALGELGPPPAAGHPGPLRADRAGEGRARGGVRQRAHPQRGPAGPERVTCQGPVPGVNRHGLPVEARSDIQPARETPIGISQSAPTPGDPGGGRGEA